MCIKDTHYTLYWSVQTCLYLVRAPGTHYTILIFAHLESISATTTWTTISRCPWPASADTHAHYFDKINETPPWGRIAISLFVCQLVCKRLVSDNMIWETFLNFGQEKNKMTRQSCGCQAAPVFLRWSVISACTQFSMFRPCFYFTPSLSFSCNVLFRCFQRAISSVTRAYNCSPAYSKRAIPFQRWRIQVISTSCITLLCRLTRSR